MYTTRERIPAVACAEDTGIIGANGQGAVAQELHDTCCMSRGASHPKPIAVPHEALVT